MGRSVITGVRNNNIPQPIVNSVHEREEPLRGIDELHHPRHAQYDHDRRQPHGLVQIVGKQNRKL